MYKFVRTFKKANRSSGAENEKPLQIDKPAVNSEPATNKTINKASPTNGQKAQQEPCTETLNSAEFLNTKEQQSKIQMRSFKRSTFFFLMSFAFAIKKD